MNSSGFRLHGFGIHSYTSYLFQAKIEEQEILMEADKEGFKDLYEGRLCNLTEELSVAHDKVCRKRIGAIPANIYF